eukprot:11552537-Ditylum_brightwellii.AAC.1
MDCGYNVHNYAVMKLQFELLDMFLTAAHSSIEILAGTDSMLGLGGDVHIDHLLKNDWNVSVNYSKITDHPQGK